MKSSTHIKCGALQEAITTHKWMKDVMLIDKTYCVYNSALHWILDMVIMQEVINQITTTPVFNQCSTSNTLNPDSSSTVPNTLKPVLKHYSIYDSSSSSSPSTFSSTQTPVFKHCNTYGSFRYSVWDTSIFLFISHQLWLLILGTYLNSCGIFDITV